MGPLRLYSERTAPWLHIANTSGRYSNLVTERPFYKTTNRLVPGKAFGGNRNAKAMELLQKKVPLTPPVSNNYFLSRQLL